ncbi:MAG: hypothetical protein M3Y41_04770 [Pseudomonadota bacterium]|nr:hypothetical protein [Pseudomonadota bacterium]
MKAVPLWPVLALALGLGPAQVRAANADHPNQNVDKSNDKGNDTGNSQTDRLNSGQLDANQPPSASPGASAPNTPVAPPR